MTILQPEVSWTPCRANQAFEEGGGFQSNHLFLNGPGGDSISPFSGDLELVVPVGPALQAGGNLQLGLSLHYSSKIWRVWSSVEQERHLTGRGPFGLGWRLHVGRVFISCRNGCNYDFGLLRDKEWIYESPDGAEHPIALGVPSGGLTYDGTTDSTFIRAEALDAAGAPLSGDAAVGQVAAWRLYLGNGLVHSFERRLEQIDANHAADQTDDFRGWYATRIERWDAPLHPVGRIAISYDAGSKAHCISRVDFFGPGAFTVPQRSITFVNEDHLGSYLVEGGYTSEIHVPAVDGQDPATAVYSFDYTGPHTVEFTVDPSRPDLDKTSGGHLMLAAVSFPEPGQGQPPLPPLRFSYDLVASGDGVTGELVRKEMPTGAAVQYEYAMYSYNVTQTTSVILREVVAKKLFLDPAADPASEPSIDPGGANPGGVWRYARLRAGGAHAQHTRVTDPFGNDTVYLFGQNECELPECADWTTGLATSVKVYQGPASWRYGGQDYPLEGQLVRVRKTRFTSDDPPDDQRGRNILPSESWMQDERGDTVGSRKLGRGPLGRFARVESYGSGVPTRRVSFTYESVAAGATPWLLWSTNRVVEKVVGEADGPPLRRATRSYTDDGRPLVAVAFSDPAGADPAAPENLETRYVYDPATMNLERSLTFKVGTPAAAYGTRVGYDATGVFVSAARHLDPAVPEAPSSQAFAWLATDVTREPATGVVVEARDPAGVSSRTFRDRLGRIVTFVPGAPETPTRISYPSVRETVVERGDPASPGYLRSRYLYDTLGRLVETRRKTQTGCEAYQRMRYDVAGRTELAGRWHFDGACSEQQKASEVALQPGCPDGTEYFYWTGPPEARRYDALGRLQKVTTADCKSTTTTYAGTATTVTVEDVGGQGPSSATSERDVYGNLVSVNAPEGADARYTYGPLGELEQVELSWVDPDQVMHSQQRRTVYDALGRGISVTNPENGTVRFTRYDAAGRVLESIDSDGTRLAFAYDAAGRLLRATAEEDVTLPGASPEAPRSYAAAVTLAQYTYDEPGGAADKTAGRLTRVESFDETGRLVSRKKLAYTGLNGRVSEEATTFALWDGREGIQMGYDKEFRTCYVFGDDGLLVEQRYPHEAACQPGSAPAGVARLTYGYRHGALESMADANRSVAPATETPLIGSVLYDATGGVTRLEHGNGVVTTVLPDVMHRVGSITVEPGAPGDPLLRTGRYGYDGAGNVTAIGDPGDPERDVFTYDRLSRLTGAEVHYSAGGEDHLVRETYEFDGFGNLTRKLKTLDPGLEQEGTPTELPTSPLTNRLESVNGSPAPHDQRGNLLSEQGRPYLFDARNRLVAAGGPDKAFPLGLYAYDAGGMRIVKERSETGERVFYVRDAAGNVLSELTVPPRKYDEYHQKDYFYALGRVLGMAEEQAPAPVEGLISTMVFHPGETTPAYGDVTMRWLANPESGVTVYRVFRRCLNETAWQLVGTVAASPSPSFAQSVVGADVEWECVYRVAAVGTSSQGELEGIPSRALRVVIAEPEPGSNFPPEGLAIERHDRSLTLRWQMASMDAGYLEEGRPTSTFLGYNVYRGVAGLWQLQPRNALPLSEPVFHDLRADDPTKTYQYQVRRVDTTGGESAGSLIATGSPGDGAPPAPPAGVRALSGPGAGQVTVLWGGSTETDLTGYRVYQKQGAAYTSLTPAPLGVATRTYTLEGLAAGQTYTFAVTAADAASESALSADASSRPRLTSLEPPPSQTGTRELSWTEPATADVRLNWGTSLEAALYKVYRKRDEEPWWAYRPVSSTTALNWKDSLIDRCAAYTYMVRAADEEGNESADPGLEVFVNRIFRPTDPSAQGNAQANTITISWDGLEGCAPEAHGFELVGWRIRTSLDKPYVYDGWVTIADPAQRSYTFTDVGPAQIVGFAVSARLRSVYHSGDPTDPAYEFDSFLSEDLCATTAQTLADGDCTDISLNDPPPPGGGGGGGGVSEPEQEDVRRLVPHHHGPFASLPESPEDDRPLVVVAAQPLGKAARGESLSTPTDPTGLHDAGEPGMPSTSSFESSPHRMVGLPSEKVFRFSYFHHDHLGSVRVVTDGAGVKRSEAKYLPFGEELMLSSGSTGNHRFTAHQRDAETGLDYMLARYYSPTLSRFTSGDPVPTGNLYAYVYGNPVLLSDPTGLTSEDERDRDQAFQDMRSMEWGFIRDEPLLDADFRAAIESCHLYCESGGGSSASGQQIDTTFTIPTDPTGGSFVAASSAAQSGGSTSETVVVTATADPPERPPLPLGTLTGEGFLSHLNSAKETALALARAAAEVPWQFTWVGPFYGPLAVSFTWKPASGDVWVAPGVGITLPTAQSATIGPLLGYDPLLSDVMNGWSFGGDVAYGGMGAQLAWNTSGSFGGPVGGYGASLSYTYGFHFQAPPVGF